MSAISGAVTLRQFSSGSWSIETGNQAMFVVSNFGFKKVHGAVPIRECIVEIDGSGQLLSSHADLDLAAIDTGNRRRDHDLAKPKLLDLQQFPLLTFDLVASGELVGGTLSAHGRSVPIDLSIELRDAAQRHVSVDVSGAFDRAALGIVAPSLMIGGRVQVEFNARFVQA